MKSSFTSRNRLPVIGLTFALVGLASCAVAQVASPPEDTPCLKYCKDHVRCNATGGLDDCLLKCLDIEKTSTVCTEALKHVASCTTSAFTCDPSSCAEAKTNYRECVESVRASTK